MCVLGAKKGWHAPQLKRGGEQLDGRVEQLFGEQLTRLGGLLVGEHERVVTRSHAPRGRRWRVPAAGARVWLLLALAALLRRDHMPSLSGSMPLKDLSSC